MNSMFAERLVHMDLKGAPPRPAFLRAIFPLFRQWGATGICLEWEDMLPYSGRLACVRHPQAYSPREVKEILAAATDAGLEVIPLVQTFGHLEFVLKHPRFSALREDPGSAHDLCPLHPQTAALARELLDQTLDLHPGVRAVHLGGDEVRALGRHPATARAIAARGRAAVYRRHLDPLLARAAARGVRALIWDDMLRGWSVSELRPLRGRVELVIWGYAPELLPRLSPGLWRRYQAAGLSLWGASAFKGACAEDTLWVDGGNRARNHAAWAACGRQRKLTGIILTGWSRFTHFSTLCELLPAGLPHLALGLAILRRGRFTDDLRRRIFVGLGLGDMPFAHARTEEIISLPTGNFPGAAVFRLAGKLQGARQLMRQVEEHQCFQYPPRNGGRVDAALVRCDARRAARAGRIARAAAAELPAALSPVLPPFAAREFLDVQARQLIAVTRHAQTLARRLTRSKATRRKERT